MATAHACACSKAVQLTIDTCVCVRSQLSLKSSAVPGRGGANVKGSDLKYSRDLYWITSRESPNVIWAEVHKPSSQLVRDYIARDKSMYEDQQFLVVGDLYDWVRLGTQLVAQVT